MLTDGFCVYGVILAVWIQAFMGASVGRGFVCLYYGFACFDYFALRAVVFWVLLILGCLCYGIW